MIDVVAALEQLQIMGMIRLHKITGSYYTLYCPIHNDGNERRPSCGILLHDEFRNGKKYPAGFVHCFTCGYVNTLPGLVTDLLKSRSITKSGIEWLTENVPGFEADTEIDLLVPWDLMEDVSSQFALDNIKSLTGSVTTYVDESELAKYRYTVPYMYERHLTDEVIDKFDVGYDANWIPTGRKKPVPCLTFPVHDESGRTLFIYRRSIKGKFFSAPEGVQKPVYGLDNVPPGTTELFVTESIINALTLWTWGYVAVALLGTGNPYQLDQLRRLGVNDIVLCMDGDDAGSRATNRIRKSLSNVSVIWSVQMPAGKDVNDLTKDEFIKLYQERE